MPRLYRTDTPSGADLRIYVTDVRTDADLVCFVTESRWEADRATMWFYTDISASPEMSV